MQLLFYTERTTPRIKYIVATLFNALGVEKYEITNDANTFNSFTGAKINYSSQPLSDNEVQITPVELLLENTIKQSSLSVFSWNNTKAFYATSGNFPFDIFAASFYLLTRYEEYLPHQKDEYGRYGHENSIAFNEGFLHLPLVNIWLQSFSTELQKKFPSLQLKKPSFRYIPTYDIDIAFNYLHKGLLRNSIGIAKSILRRDWYMLKEMIAVISGKQKDPFDLYEWLDELHAKASLEAHYFFLLARHYKGYDRNINPYNRSFQNLINEVALKNKVGIHPSWQSGDNTALLSDEVRKMEHIINKKITRSRQHYIRMTLPDTYRNLISAGITEDFSMGYGSINGFRASYCLPYNWYDLKQETQTNLLIYPFCWMEANAYYEQHLSLEQAKQELEHYYLITKEVNGSLITVCHNHILGNEKLLKGWRQMYEHFCLNVAIEVK